MLKSEEIIIWIMQQYNANFVWFGRNRSSKNRTVTWIFHLKLDISRTFNHDGYVTYTARLRRISTQRSLLKLDICRMCKLVGFVTYTPRMPYIYARLHTAVVAAYTTFTHARLGDGHVWRICNVHVEGRRKPSDFRYISAMNKAA